MACGVTQTQAEVLAWPSAVWLLASYLTSLNLIVSHLLKGADKMVQYAKQAVGKNKGLSPVPQPSAPSSI